MKKIIFLVLTIGALLLINGCNTSEESSEKSSKDKNSNKVKLSKSYKYKTMEELANKSEYIVKTTIGKQKEKITEHGIEFIITEIIVDESLKGDLQKKINLIQTYSNADSIVKEGTKTLLYLENYIGPLANNVYVCVGLGEGQFIIKDTKLKPSVKLNVDLEKSFKKNQYIKDIRKTIKK